MNLKELASTVADFEGKKHEASIGDIREILKILVQLDAYDQVPVMAILGAEILKELKQK